MNSIQKIFGNLFLYCLLFITLNFKLSVILFIIFSFIIKIDRHPVDHLNPFAFAVRLRRIHLVNRS